MIVSTLQVRRGPENLPIEEKDFEDSLVLLIWEL
jgi:hypothetical protein